jgi:hypothetical protein
MQIAEEAKVLIERTSEMHNRHSLYREIHKGLRSLLLGLVEHAGRTSFSDASEVASLNERVRACFRLLELHAHHENTFIGPELERRLPELARHIGTAHESHEPQMSGLLELLDSIAAGDGNAPGQGHAFVVALSKLAAELMLHMAEEEELVMPALWRVATDDELIEIEQRLVGSIPSDEMESYLRWMIPAMNTPERIAMLRSMRAGAPEVVFAGVRELARTILSPAEEEALSSGLAAVA